MKDAKMKAKLEALQKLKQMSKKEDQELIGKKMSGKLPVKKVTVAAPTEEGLEEGLSLAEKIMRKRKESSSSEESSEEEGPSADQMLKMMKGLDLKGLMSEEDEDLEDEFEDGDEFACGGLGKKY